LPGGAIIAEDECVERGKGCALLKSPDVSLRLLNDVSGILWPFIGESRLEGEEDAFVTSQQPLVLFGHSGKHGKQVSEEIIAPCRSTYTTL
jgi:hypothetical protein